MVGGMAVKHGLLFLVPCLFRFNPDYSRSRTPAPRRGYCDNHGSLTLFTFVGFRYFIWAGCLSLISAISV